MNPYRDPLLGNWQTIPPEFAEQIVSNVTGGLTPRLAAKKARVPWGIVRRWLEIGYEECEDGKLLTDFGQLYVEVEAAQGDLAFDLVQKIRRAEKGEDWKPSAWLLARLEREDYGDRQEESRAPVTIVVQTAFPGLRPALDGSPNDAIEVKSATFRELPSVA